MTGRLLTRTILVLTSAPRHFPIPHTFDEICIRSKGTSRSAPLYETGSPQRMHAKAKVLTAPEVYPV